MRDQATMLRALVARQRHVVPTVTPHVARRLLFAGGKSGVGQTSVVVQLANHLQRAGESVCILDASESVGHAALLLGMNAYWNLSHVQCGARHWQDVALRSTTGVTVLSGADCLVSALANDLACEHDLDSTLQQLEASFDVVLWDVPRSLFRQAIPVARRADETIVMATPDALAIADGYSAIKHLSAQQVPHIGVVINRATREWGDNVATRMIATAAAHLHQHVERLGVIPEWDAVQSATASNHSGVPAWALDERLHTSVTAALEHVASRLPRQHQTRPGPPVSKMEWSHDAA